MSSQSDEAERRTQDERSAVRASLRLMRKTLIDYLAAKTQSEDWHAVSDAANDLREVDAQLAVLRGGL